MSFFASRWMMYVACLPLGLALCALCGVHVCPAEVAVALDLWRGVLPMVRP